MSAGPQDAVTMEQLVEIDPEILGLADPDAFDNGAVIDVRRQIIEETAEHRHSAFEDYVTVSEAVRFCRASKNQVYYSIRDASVPLRAIKRAGRWFVNLDDLIPYSNVMLLRRYKREGNKSGVARMTTMLADTRISSLITNAERQAAKIRERAEKDAERIRNRAIQQAERDAERQTRVTARQSQLATLPEEKRYGTREHPMRHPDNRPVMSEFPEPVLTVEQVAERLGLSMGTVNAYVSPSVQTLPAYLTTDHKVVVPESAVEAYREKRLRRLANQTARQAEGAAASGD